MQLTGAGGSVSWDSCCSASSSCSKCRRTAGLSWSQLQQPAWRYSSVVGTPHAAAAVPV
jgi:hypothetical protein